MVPPIFLDSILSTLLGFRGEEARDVFGAFFHDLPAPVVNAGVTPPEAGGRRPG